MDIYDKAVEYFTEHPNEINDAWNWPTTFKNTEGEQIGLLFKHLGGSHKDSEDTECGCLTQVKFDMGCYPMIDGVKDVEFYDLIKADDSIPTSGTQIEVSHLETFAKYQRMWDEKHNVNPLNFVE